MYMPWKNIVYTEQKRNAAGELGHSGLKNMSAVLRMLVYGVPTDSLDDWVAIAESTLILSLRIFVKYVVQIFREQYLQTLNEEDTTSLIEMGATRGFPGMIGCIDCMH